MAYWSASTWPLARRRPVNPARRSMARQRKAAPIGEAGEVDADHRGLRQVGQDVRRCVGRQVDPVAAIIRRLSLKPTKPAVQSSVVNPLSVTIMLMLPVLVLCALPFTKWMPHSVLSLPRQRRRAGLRWSLTRVVQGMQPMEG